MDNNLLNDVTNISPDPIIVDNNDDKFEYIYKLAIRPELINDKTILITGGTGSFGKKLIGILHKHFTPHKIIIYSRDEYKQSLLKEMYPQHKYPNMRYFIGDIRDLDRMLTAFKGVHIIFHTAALKRIQECEYNPMESIKTNINGTDNVVNAAIRCGVQYVMALSTDKACSPVNLYGATKLCAEKLVINGNLLSNGATKFAVCRYGNQFGSRGSLVEIFNRAKKNNLPLTVTNLSMSRFTILLEEAVFFVLNCLDKMTGGEIFIPKLPSYTVEQMVECFDALDNYSVIGTRPGEKFHELMISADESHLAYEFSDFFILVPLEEHDIQKFNIEHYAYLSYKKVPPQLVYSSDKAYLISNERLKYLINNYKE